VVARYADACNLSADPPVIVAHKLEVLARHCDAEDRDYDAIDKTILGFAQPLDDPDGFLAPMEACAALGIDSVSLMPMTDDPVASVTRLCDEVVPNVVQIGS